MYRAKSKQQIVLEAINNLSSRTSITQLSSGSKARALIEVVGQVVGSVSADVSDGIMQTLLTDASGVTLDLIAESYGIQRLKAVPPRIQEADGNLRYYVRRGNFGAINNNSNILIPRGTQIRAQTNNATVYFVQRDNVVLSAGDSQAYFSADQIGQNLGSSVAPGSLTKHNFVGYADANFNSLLVTNDKGVAGRPQESDANLRFRIRSQITSSATCNTTAIRTAGLAVPGVADIRILENRAGLGTFDVIVFGISPSVSSTTLQEVQNRIDQVTAMGCRGIAVAPNLVGISLATSIRFRSDTTQSEKNQITSEVNDSIREYINGLLPEQDLLINALVQRIVSVSDKIIDIGTPGKPFAELLIWKQNGPNSRRFSRHLQATYHIKDNEDLVIEPFIELPIRLSEGS